MIDLTDEMVSRLDSALATGYSCLVRHGIQEWRTSDKPPREA